jgi:hypothetical protein
MWTFGVWWVLVLFFSTVAQGEREDGGACGVAAVEVNRVETLEEVRDRLATALDNLPPEQAALGRAAFRVAMDPQALHLNRTGAADYAIRCANDSERIQKLEDSFRDPGGLNLTPDAARDLAIRWAFRDAQELARVRSALRFLGVNPANELNDIRRAEGLAYSPTIQVKFVRFHEIFSWLAHDPKGPGLSQKEARTAAFRYLNGTAEAFEAYRREFKPPPDRGETFGTASAPPPDLAPLFEAIPQVLTKKDETALVRTATKQTGLNLSARGAQRLVNELRVRGKTNEDFMKTQSYILLRRIQKPEEGERGHIAEALDLLENPTPTATLFHDAISFLTGTANRKFAEATPLAQKILQAPPGKLTEFKVAYRRAQTGVSPGVALNRALRATGLE